MNDNFYRYTSHYTTFRGTGGYVDVGLYTLMEYKDLVIMNLSVSYRISQSVYIICGMNINIK